MHRFSRRLAAVALRQSPPAATQVVHHMDARPAASDSPHDAEASTMIGGSRLRSPAVLELRSLCVYCGSSRGADPAYAAAAQALGGLLARRDVRLVYGGGKVGLMGVLA